MSDLISRADAIAYIDRVIKSGLGKSKSLDYIRKYISALPSADTDWIPCSERLPSEKDGRVLVTKRGKVMTAIYSEFSGTWYLGEMCAVGGEDPIVWMPLPKPYKEDGEV